MAIYNGREVSIQQVSPVSLADQDVVITYPDHRLERVKLSQLQLTDSEKKDLQKNRSDNFDSIKTVSDKDVQRVRDSHDPDKVDRVAKEQRKEKEQANK